MIITTLPQPEFKQCGSLYYTADETIVVRENKDWLLLFNGYLYPDIPVTVDDLFAQLAGGQIHQSLEQFKGQFCAFLISKNTDQPMIKICTDILGMRDIFYHYKDKNLIISTKFTDFFQLKNFSQDDLDSTAIAEFLLYEHVFHDRTFISSIKLLPYASVGTFLLAEERCITERYWEFTYTPERKKSRREVYEQLDSLFTKAMERIAAVASPQPFIIGLSGGLDSRLVAFYAKKMGFDLSAFLFGTAGADAFDISRQIADSLQISLSINEVPDSFFSSYKEHMQYDPMMNVMYTAYTSIGDSLPAKANMLTGFNGDNMFGSHLRTTDFLSFLSISDKINRRYRLKLGQSLNKIFNADILDAIETDLNRYKYTHLKPWELCEWFNFENRQLRFIKNVSCFHFYDKYPWFSPFTDIDLVQYALTFPLSSLRHSSLYHGFLKYRLGDLARIRSERKPYALSDPFVAKQAKAILLELKFRLAKYKIKLPVFDYISYSGTLDWTYLFSKTPFSQIIKPLAVQGVNDSVLCSLSENINSVRLQFHYLTISLFMHQYLR